MSVPKVLPKPPAKIVLKKIKKSNVPDFESQKSIEKIKYSLPLDTESPEVIQKIEKAEEGF